MRAKKARMLRKLTLQMTTGMPMVQYHDKALNPRKPTHRTRFLYECSRLAYQNLKKRYKVNFGRGRIM